MSSLPAQTSPTYCTDEDVVARCGGDFITLCPSWQSMAAGSDGVFTDPWTLVSASIDFALNGVRPNHVILLTAPRAVFPGGGTLLAVDTVTSGSITLRRIHKEVGVGMPPAPNGELTGVGFVVNTLDPQIEEASWEIKRRFSIDEEIVYRQSSWIYDLRDLRMATVLSVLDVRYSTEARGDRGDYPRKILLLRRQLDDVLGRVQVRWGPKGNSEPPTTIFDHRLIR